MNSTRNIGREIGTAFAVLAIYLLTILAPLHHARASQLAFEDLGYATIEASWVLCTPTGAEGQDRDVLAKCPATGVGKAEFILPVLAVLPVALDIATLAAPLSVTTPAFLPRTAASPGGPRAPPVLV